MSFIRGAYITGDENHDDRIDGRRQGWSTATEPSWYLVDEIDRRIAEPRRHAVDDDSYAAESCQVSTAPTIYIHFLSAVYSQTYQQTCIGSIWPGAN
jgi:hypothetical protein